MPISTDFTSPSATRSFATCPRRISSRACSLATATSGVCVTVRPDALGLHLGKEDSWDIRVSEDHYQHVLPFNELLKLWERASEEAKRQGKPDMLYLEYGIDFFREYTQKVTSSYAKSWPRPWPCGIVWIHWDSRKVRVRQATARPFERHCSRSSSSTTTCAASIAELTLRCFVNWNFGHVSVSSDEPAPFVSVAYCPNLDACGPTSAA